MAVILNHYLKLFDEFVSQSYSIIVRAILIYNINVCTYQHLLLGGNSQRTFFSN